ncbi:MAG: amidohydrolase family protein [Rhodospirillaceae bacterium]|jgi:predicted TIM-barrel fold metal-dependent hydrolase|nr:amidohydrolase family protein [Rhodospirillaceae bacterium]MBT7954850.1 amidohydrolase family protein [Rhodospirillaceae bacterium]
MNVIRTMDTEAAKIRKNLNHPIVDGDGHFLEINKVLLDYVKKVAGPDFAEKFDNRKLYWMKTGTKHIFWGQPSGPNSLDRATAMLPNLFAARLDEAGLDFGIVYSTIVLAIMHDTEDEFRQVGHRALNMMMADLFRDVSDRLVPSAGIPMYTPEEALAELDFVVNELGFKAATFGTERRLAPALLAEAAPQLKNTFFEVSPVALDTEHNYDQVWQRCIDLKIAVASHTSSRGNYGRRNSPSNYVFNHIGDFAGGGNYFCRCLFFDGVTRRFPELNFAFLEGGAGWASQLYNDIIEHWEKRNIDAMHANLDPSTLDMDLIAEMAEKYGGNIITREDALAQRQGFRMGGVLDQEIELDEFKRCEIAKKEDIAELFVDPFYFGCEADDRLNAIAFNPKLNHFDRKLKAMFGSDIGHWDVTDMTRVLPDAYEAVENGLMSEDDFRDFTFTNPVMFFAKQNPDFFKGTRVETEVDKLLAEHTA